MTSAFHFSAPLGQSEAVLQAIQDQKATPADGDQRLVEAAKKFIATLVAFAPPKMNAVRIIAEGQLDSDTGRSTVTIQVMPQQILLNRNP